MVLKESWSDVNGVPTCILTKEGTNGNGRDPKQPIIVIISGNPGMPHFYEEFMENIDYQTGGNITIKCIGMVGFSKIPNTAQHLKKHVPSYHYSLDGNVDHKLSFIKNTIPEETPVILLGHSIGAYICLEIMKALPREKVKFAGLLFPTIERMDQSSSGKKAKPLLHNIFYVVIVLLYILLTPLIFAFHCLPKTVQSKAVKWHQEHFSDNEVPSGCCIRTVVNHFSAQTLHLAFHLLWYELKQVSNKANYAFLEANKDRLMLCYAEVDAWVPGFCFNEMKRSVPLLDARLCTGFTHAFCTDSNQNQEMAGIVWREIARHIVINVG